MAGESAMLQTTKSVSHDDIDLSLNKLPDEILSIIISYLITEKVARTSILSKRWRYLWTFTTKSLELIKPWRLCETKERELMLPKFIDWVNHVLHLHCGAFIDDIVIILFTNDYIKDSTVVESMNDNVGNYLQRCIDNWINFALRKRVKRLMLDFRSTLGTHSATGLYTLSTQLLHNYNLDRLTDLKLFNIEVTGDVLEHVLSKCTSLSQLSVANPESLVSLKVSESDAAKLKYLVMVDCVGLQCIEISSTNLTFIEYDGKSIGFSFQDVPRLVDASFGMPYSTDLLENSFTGLSKLIPQLEYLSLEFDIERDSNYCATYPKFKNLKHLVLMILVAGKNVFLSSAPLLEAVPLLQRLVLSFEWFIDTPAVENVDEWKTISSHKFECLRELKLYGFVGCQEDMNFCLCVIKNAASLEKVIMDPRDYRLVREGYIHMKSQQIMESRIRAKQLEKYVPLGVEFVIL